MKTNRKFIGFLMLALVTVGACAFCGCSAGEKAAEQNVPDEIITSDEVSVISDEQIEMMSGKKPGIITKDEAQELCAEVLGEYDPDTGFLMSYRCGEVISAGGKIYYVVYMSWLVDNSHLSRIGECFVSVDGKEIYNGSAFDGDYEITERIWPENQK